MLKEKTLWFNFDMIWIAGSKHCGPDYMSRRPKEARLDCIMGFAKATSDPEAVSINDLHIVDSIVGSLASCLTADDVRAITFEEIKAEVARDQEMLDLIKAIKNKDDTDKFPDVVASYNRHQDNLLVLMVFPCWAGEW